MVDKWWIAGGQIVEKYYRASVFCLLEHKNNVFKKIVSTRSPQQGVGVKLSTKLSTTYPPLIHHPEGCVKKEKIKAYFVSIVNVEVF